MPNPIITFTRTNRRDNNEDACLAFSLDCKMPMGGEIQVLLLADGMGGHDYGEIASYRAISIMASFVAKHCIEHSILPNPFASRHLPLAELNFKQMLYFGLGHTNNQFLQYCQENKLHRAGATLLTVIVHGNRFYFGGLGDSRLYCWRQNTQQLERLSQDHNVPGIAVLENRLDPLQAERHPQRNQLVYFIGNDGMPDPDKIPCSGEGELQQGDALLLCTDGMYGNLGDTTLTDVFSNYFKLVLDAPAEHADSFMHYIAERGARLGETDNQSAVLYVQHTSHQKKTTSALNSAQFATGDTGIRTLDLGMTESEAECTPSFREDEIASTEPKTEYMEERTKRKFFRKLFN